MKKGIKIISILLVFSIFMCSSLTTSAVIPTVNYDSFFINIGCPQEVLLQMSNNQKEYIYENILKNSDNGTIEFCGFERKEITLSNDSALSRGGIISDDDLTLSVFAVKNSFTSGESYYTVCPAFVWHGATHVANDSFSMAMYSGWSVRPGDRNFRLHSLGSDGSVIDDPVDIAPAGASESGYTFKVPQNIGKSLRYYEGNAYFDVDKTASNAQSRVSLQYTHDASPSLSISYSISIGVGSISINPTSNKYLFFKSDNFEVAGLNY